MSEREPFIRANICQANMENQVIIKFMRDLALFLSELEHRMGIDNTYAVPMKGVILDEKIPKLKYYGPILVVKQEVLDKAIHDYLMH